LPAAMQSSEVVNVQVVYSDVYHTHEQRAIGCKLIYKQIKRTKYDVKNNSTDRIVNKFYIDHTADASNGGYVITTNENRIKSVVGFSRYEFHLPPLKSIEFIVTEEASYETPIFTYGLTDFIKNKSAKLLADGMLKEADYKILVNAIKREASISALSTIASESFTERDLLNWKAGTAVDSSTPIIEKSFLDKAEQILVKKTASEEKKKNINTLKERIQKIFKNQERLRDNIRSLEKISAKDLMNRYLTDLDKEEDDLVATTSSITTLEDEQSKIDREIVDAKMVLATEARKAKDRL